MKRKNTPGTLSSGNIENNNNIANVEERAQAQTTHTYERQAHFHFTLFLFHFDVSHNAKYT